jgi:hypothetical protein
MTAAALIIGARDFASPGDLEEIGRGGTALSSP